MKVFHLIFAAFIVECFFDQRKHISPFQGSNLERL